MKKKILMLLLASAVLVACGSKGEKKEDNTNFEVKQEATKSNTEIKKNEEKKETKQTKEIQIGDKVVVKDKFEITFNKIEFSKNVLPKNQPDFYTHYPAKEGKVYIYIDTDVKNLQKQNLSTIKVADFTADYNNGYTYTFFSVPQDEMQGFSITEKQINPLETMGVAFLSDCPEEVETSTNPLIIKFTIDNIDYIYKMK